MTKQLTNIFIHFFILSIFTGVSVATEISTEDRVTALEERVIKLEQSLNFLNSLKKLKSKKSPKIDKIKCLLNLVDWDLHFQENNNYKSYNITYILENRYGKGIKLIDGSIGFEDLLETDIYRIKVAPDLKIAPGESIDFSGEYGVNQFMPDQLRMKDMDKEDIIPRLKVKRLVFDDNSILKF